MDGIVEEMALAQKLMIEECNLKQSNRLIDNFVRCCMFCRALYWPFGMLALFRTDDNDCWFVEGKWSSVHQQFSDIGFALEFILILSGHLLMNLPCGVRIANMILKFLAWIFYGSFLLFTGLYFSSITSSKFFSRDTVYSNK